MLIFSLAAHPNIKLFIYQGGLQSTEEAVYYGIPLVGFPVVWDQIYQVQNIVRLGIGVRLQLNNLSRESIETSVHEVINNKRYRINHRLINNLTPLVSHIDRCDIKIKAFMCLKM